MFTTYLTFDPTDWTISVEADIAPVARQYDNQSRAIIANGTPDGWTFDLIVQAQNGGKTYLDIIQMESMDGGVGVVLTDQQLSFFGTYLIQMRGTQGEQIIHTNLVAVSIPGSLSGTAQWPTVPSEFTQIEDNILELNQHPPYPGDNGYWMVWDLDTDAYVESQLPLPPVAVGPSGTITVGETTTGEPGTPASVVNTGTDTAAVLNFTIPAGQKGDPGAAATVVVGETVTGAPGTEASVENVGTSSAAVLRFTIPAGATGATPDISVEVTGLPGGSEPTVSVSGTPEAPVISLGIPAGQQGDPGNPGQTPNITIGSVETLPAGSDVTASISGQTPNLVLNLGIPQGRQGDPGQAATVTVGTTTTGAPGSQASVVNSGTESAAVLNFTIPAGETGAGLPSTDTAQSGDVPTWDGENVVWAPPAGGSDRAWTMLGETDCSVVGGDIIYNGLDNFTEFLILTETVKNNESINSAYGLYINGKFVVDQILPINSESLGTELYRWAYIHYNGLFWDSRSTGGTIALTSIRTSNANALYPYSLILDVGSATEFILRAPVTQYQAVSGKIKVWGR